MKDSVAFIIHDIDNLPVNVYLNDTKSDVIQYGYDVGGTYTYYVNNSAGQTEAVQRGTANNCYTYNLYGIDNFGQVKVDSSTVNRYYYLKDHLGDVCITLNSSGSVDSYNDYYPFGMQMDSRNGSSSADGRYKFGGKELDVETQYNWFEVRGYDSRIGRFLGTDPHGTNYPGISSYCYAGDNPMAFNDPSGMDSTAAQQQSSSTQQQTTQTAQQASTATTQQTITFTCNLQYVQPCSTSVGTQNTSSAQTNENVLKSFILPAAKGIEIASEVKDVAEVAHVELPLLENATWLGPAGALAAGAIATEEYNNGEISLGRALYNGTTPAVATAVALTVTPTAGAVVGTGFVVGALGYDGVNAAAKMLNNACTDFYYQASSPLIPGGF